MGGKGGHRRGMKGAGSKRLNHRAPPIGSKREEVESVCDNSNDSGLGFDHHTEIPHTVSPTYSEQEYWNGVEGGKKRRLDIKLETDDANDDFTFPRLPTPTQQLLCSRRETSNNANGGGVTVGGGKVGRRGVSGAGVGCALSRDSKVELRIVSQPEGQHRARYQTEGSRGAVKDTSGNGFPVVKLSGYERGATLEVYIGTDQGRVAPHMFYQACKVSGKNSTPCVERKLNGTVLIQIDFDPAKDMIITCDCVGILKERNVDVEQRFPEEGSSRSRKKSTRCRMVFRTTVTRPDGSLETLQVTSHPIVCTQPPGVPEICKKSLSSCPAAGGIELFILGKNFLKDTRVVFSEGDPNSIDYWEASVTPDKDFLQQSHLVCTIPAYRREDIKERRCVRLWIVSGGRQSEVQGFVYTAVGTAPSQALPQDYTTAPRVVAQSLPVTNGLVSGSIVIGTAVKPVFIAEQPKPDVVAFTAPIKGVGGEEGWRQADPSMATLRRFVTDSTAPLPALSVDTYLSRLESHPPVGGGGLDLLQTVRGSAAAALGLPPPAAPRALDLLPPPPPPPPAPSTAAVPLELLPGAAAARASPPGVPLDLLPTAAPAGPAPPLDLGGPPREVALDLLPVPPVVALELLPPPDSSSLNLLPPPSLVSAPPPPPLALLPPADSPAAAPPLALALLPPPPTSPSQSVPPPPLRLLLPAPEDKAQEPPPPKKADIPLHEITQMSEHDLLSYINPSCFDQV